MDSTQDQAGTRDLEPEGPHVGVGELVFLRRMVVTIDRITGLVVAHYTVFRVKAGTTRVEKLKGSWGNFNLMAEELDALISG